MAQPPTGRTLIEAIEAVAPPGLAEPWDNVGLLLGDAGAALTGPVLLTIDLTSGVMDEAEGLGAGAIVAYHPPIFKPISRLTAERPRGAVLLRALRAGMLVYSPHTALDAAADGLTDWLAEAVGAGDVRALTPSAEPGERLKIVTFAPADAVERLRHALATAGAGRIGGYELCSFAAEGTGTFMGGAGTNPALGASGRFEQVWEVRLEMICPARAAALAVDTLRAMHPYEEPAIDVYPLRPLPMRAAGAGRRVMLDRPATLGALVDRVRAHLGVERLKFASPWEHEPERPVRAVGLCAGAGEELVPSAAENGCEVFVTGEMRHHEIMAALDRGMAVILAGHTSTERGYLPRLAQRLGRLAPGLRFAVSSADRTPIRWA